MDEGECNRQLTVPESPPKARRGLRVAGGLLLLAALFVLGYVAAFLWTPYYGHPSVAEIEISRGDTFDTIARGLGDKGVVSQPRLFVFWARLRGLDTKVHRGLYRFEGAVSPRSVLDALVRGRTVVNKVTIPEGFTVRQIGALLERKGLVTPAEFAVAVSDPAVLSPLGTGSMEGYLFPTTYHFRALATEEEVVKTMFAEFRNVFTPEMETRARELGLTRHELVTLASIIEKESGPGDEMPIISAVFHNRLKLGMRLQSDPTVIYGLADFNGDLTRKDLRSPGPYNTYTIRGLPPGPIANPGLAAMKAALFPAEVGYLYFVSKNDGSHHFSENLREHNLAVAKYQKNRRAETP